MHGSNTVTQGIRVTVTPSYLDSQSDPATRQFVFRYDIVIANEGDRRARLRSRHWIIIDAHGVRRDVHGAGVVGEFPDLAPGAKHEYASHCPLETEWGTMEGTFLMEREDGSTFEAQVGRFFLVAQPKTSPARRSRVV